MEQDLFLITPMPKEAVAAGLVFQPSTCNACHAVLTHFLEHMVCPQCKGIPLLKKEFNFFFLFGLNTQFFMDPQVLSERFFQICDLLHPDRCMHLPEPFQKAALDRMGLVNQAFEILWVSTRRRHYILDRFSPVPDPLKVHPITAEWFEIQEGLEVQNNPVVVDAFLQKLNALIYSIQQEQHDYESRFDKSYDLSLLKGLKVLSMQAKTLDALLHDVQQWKSLYG